MSGKKRKNKKNRECLTKKRDKPKDTTESKVAIQGRRTKRMFESVNGLVEKWRLINKSLTKIDKDDTIKKGGTVSRCDYCNDGDDSRIAYHAPFGWLCKPCIEIWPETPRQWVERSLASTQKKLQSSLAKLACIDALLEASVDLTKSIYEDLDPVILGEEVEKRKEVLVEERDDLRNQEKVLNGMLDELEIVLDLI